MNDFNLKDQGEISKPEQLCEVFLLYFDEEFGHIPLLITPDESIKENNEVMRLINIHSIWFLDISDESSPDRIDLEYESKMYFAKKFLVPSKREKRRLGSKEDGFETLVLILTLPIDMDIFGGALLKKMAERIKKHFKLTIYHLIKSEIAKMNVIRTSADIELIRMGEALKKRISSLIKNTCSQYFQSVIKKTDSTTLKIQKAISYLSLKGVPINYIIDSEKQDFDFSSIKLFESKVGADKVFSTKKNFKVLNVYLDTKTQDLEILLKNQTKTTFNHIYAKVISIHDFFENEILHEHIEKWLPEEELIIILPDISISHEYMLSILNGDSKSTLFKQKIDISI